MTHSHAPRLMVTVSSLILLMLFAACAGPQGEQGLQGPEGPPGPAGPQGAAGPSGASGAVVIPEYAGSEACAECHEQIAEIFSLSGHPYKLNKVENGQPPEYPFSQVPDPPEGYTWDDISYVIGGYGWKARFIDQNGYIITGDGDATTQYNLYNEDLEMGGNWAAYHAGETEKPYDCGACHTTGYSAWPPDEHQDDLPGLIGTWALPGVQCEACHGPSGIHVQEPEAQLPIVDRDSQLCGQCHVRNDPSTIDVNGIFSQHHEQYEDYFQSQHRALDCVDCHDPHATTRYQAQAVALGSPPGVIIECENCHWEEDEFYPEGHRAPDCIDCHMARVSKSALGDAGRLRGDIPSHLFAINPFAIDQFYEDREGNTYLESFITVPYACTSCHYPDGYAEVRPLREMLDFAQGYHDRPAPPPAATDNPDNEEQP